MNLNAIININDRHWHHHSRGRLFRNNKQFFRCICEDNAFSKMHDPIAKINVASVRSLFLHPFSWRRFGPVKELIGNADNIILSINTDIVKILQYLPDEFARKTVRLIYSIYVFS